MSLGPVDLHRQRVAGGVFLALLGGAVSLVLLLSGRTLGQGLAFEVEFATPGALRSGAIIFVGGHEAGVVRGVRTIGGAPASAATGPSAQPADGASGDDEDRRRRHVVADCFVLREWAPEVHTNSDIFVATPSVLGEAFLEVAPPRGGASEGPAVSEGARLRGSDPPDIDRLLQKVYLSATEALVLLRAQRPAFDELLAAVDSLLVTLATTRGDTAAGGGELQRIMHRVSDGLGDAAALRDLARDTRALPRLRTLARDLSKLADETRPDLRALADRASLASKQVDALRALFGPAESARVSAALSTLGDGARRAEKVAAAVSTRARLVENGRGSAGGFLGDRELWDDLHETQRILKWNAWRLFIKTKKDAPTRP